jgi:hypothetical protein
MQAAGVGKGWLGWGRCARPTNGALPKQGGVEVMVEAMRRFRCVSVQRGCGAGGGARCVWEGEVGVSGWSWRCSWDSSSVHARGFGKGCFGCQAWNRDGG